MLLRPLCSHSSKAASQPAKQSASLVGSNRLMVSGIDDLPSGLQGVDPPVAAKSNFRRTPPQWRIPRNSGGERPFG
jgi:hypothetical protein